MNAYRWTNLVDPVKETAGAIDAEDSWARGKACVRGGPLSHRLQLFGERSLLRRQLPRASLRAF
jgi:hypothetical protein